MNSQKSILLGAVLIIAVTNGCSLIGLGVGAISDASKPDKTSIPGWEMVSLKPGTAIAGNRKSGEVLSGKYVGVSPEEYAAKYNDCQRRSAEFAALPQLGDSVVIHLKPAREFSGRFAGVDATTLALFWKS